MIAAVILYALSYLFSSLNFSILIFRLLGKGDPREQFSGNAGTTNVFRVLGKSWAALVLILDVGRAVLIGYLSVQLLQPSFAPWTGFFLVLGNRFPLFHGFRGGKGVANYLGFTCVLAPLAGLISCAVWVLVYAVVRVPFIASFFMISVCAAGTVLIYLAHPAAAAGALVTAVFVFLNHRKNIALYIESKKKEDEGD